MKSYEDIVKEYRKRQRDTVVDTIATGLTYMDEVAVESGVLEETGLMADLTSSLTGALPFAIILATEGTKVILGRKPGITGLKDGAWRMTKTGAAICVGGAVMAGVGLWAAIPSTMGVRALFDKYRSKALTGVRVQSRISRLQQLNRQLQTPQAAPSEEESPITVAEAMGYIE